MARPEDVILALVTVGEPADPSCRPVFLESFLPSGQDLVGVSLMSDIEDNLVRWSVVDIVQSDNKLNGTETGSEMPWILRAALYDVFTDLGAQSLE